MPKTILVVQSRAGSQEVGVINDNECSVLSTIEAGPRSSLGVKLIYSRFFERPDLNYGHLKNFKEPEILIFSLRRKF